MHHQLNKCIAVVNALDNNFGEFWGTRGYII